MTAAFSPRPLPDYGTRSPGRLTVATDGQLAKRQALGGLAFETGADIAVVEVGELAELDRHGGTLWVELAEAPDDEAVTLLDAIQAVALRGRTSCVLSASPEWIDLVAARIVAPEVAVLIAPTEIERVAALGLATSVIATPLGERSIDRSDERLRQLSEEVGRIATALARLSDAPVTPGTMRPLQPGEGPAVSAELIRSVIKARRLRDEFMPGDLFADPAWDILLDLLSAEIMQHRVPVSSLCIASAVPPTTALRWIRTMTERSMVQRREDPRDARRVFIELAPATSSALRRYFDKVGSMPVI